MERDDDVVKVGGGENPPAKFAAAKKLLKAVRKLPRASTIRTRRNDTAVVMVKVAQDFLFFPSSLLRALSHLRTPSAFGPLKLRLVTHESR